MADNSRSRTWLWIIIGGGAFFLFVLAVFTLVYLTLHAGGERGALGGFGDKIGVVDLEGVIIDRSRSSSSSRNSAMTIPSKRSFCT